MSISVFPLCFIVKLVMFEGTCMGAEDGHACNYFLDREIIIFGKFSLFILSS